MTNAIHEETHFAKKILQAMTPTVCARGKGGFGIPLRRHVYPCGSATSSKYPSSPSMAHTTCGLGTHQLLKGAFAYCGEAMSRTLIGTNGTPASDRYEGHNPSCSLVKAI